MASKGFQEFHDDEPQTKLLQDTRPSASRLYPSIPSDSRYDATDSEPRKEGTAIAEKFHHQKNLDKFFGNAYEYYHRKGLYCVLATALFNRIGILFVAILFLIVFGCIDYTALYNHIHSPICPNEIENTASLFQLDCYGNHPISYQHLHQTSSFVWLCMLVFSLCWVFEMYKLIKNVPDWLEMRIFFEQVLRISPRDLKSISWDRVLEKIVEVQKDIKLSIILPELDHENIVNMICRNDNFYIALFQKQWMADAFTLHQGGTIWVSIPMQWNLMRCINSTLFSSPHTLKEEVKNGNVSDRTRIITELSHSFKISAIFNLIFLPFIAIIRLAYFCFENSDEWKSRPSTLGMRRWTPYARWLLRDYNEVAHIFEKRLRQCYEPATNYVTLFVSEPIVVASRFAVFVFGGFFLVILAFSVLFDDELLVSTLFWNRSVAWWLAFVGIALAIFRSQIPAENYVFEPKVHMEKIQANAHAFHKLLELSQHNQESWETYEKFAALFKLKVVVFLEELIGFFVTPYILFFVMPELAPKIVDFFKKNTSSVEGLGDICRDARFQEQAKEIRETFQGHVRVTDGATTVSISPMEVDSKRKVMESMIHFKATNPLWKPDMETQAMFDDMQELIDQAQWQVRNPSSSARGLQQSIILLDQNPRESAAILQKRYSRFSQFQ